MCTAGGEGVQQLQWLGVVSAPLENFARDGYGLCTGDRQCVQLLVLPLAATGSKLAASLAREAGNC